MAYTSNTLIFKNGILLAYDIDYHISGDTITYEVPLESADKITIIENEDDVYIYSGNGTTITTSIDINKNTLVFLNGVKELLNTDYTYSGQTITFNINLSSVDNVIVLDNTIFDLIYNTSNLTIKKDIEIPIPYYVQMSSDSLVFLNGVKLDDSDCTLDTTANIITFNKDLVGDVLTITGTDVSSNTRIPSNLMAYKPKIYQTALCWETNPLSTDDISEIEYKIEVDVKDTFDTINLKTFTKDSEEVVDYQNGTFFKSFVFNDITLFQDQDYYFRVCSLNPYASDWSEIYKFQINKVTWYEDTENINNLLPDNYVYTKIGYTKVKKVLELYMRLIGDFKKEYMQVSNNYNYEKIQDEDLYSMLGILLNHTRSGTSNAIIGYKYELLHLWDAFLKQGTIEALNLLIKTFYGVLPTYTILKNVVDIWKVYDTEFLLSIGNTAPYQEVQAGDSYYNTDTNKIVTALKTTNENILNYISETQYEHGINNIFKDTETNKIWLSCDNGYIGVTDNDDLTDITYYRLLDSNNNAIVEDIKYFGYIKGKVSGTVKYYYYAITNTTIYFYSLDTTLAVYYFMYKGEYAINEYLNNSVCQCDGVDYDENDNEYAVKRLILFDGVNSYIIQVGPGSVISNINIISTPIINSDNCLFSYGDGYGTNLFWVGDGASNWGLYWNNDVDGTSTRLDLFDKPNLFKLENYDVSDINNLQFNTYSFENVNNETQITFGRIKVYRNSGAAEESQPLIDDIDVASGFRTITVTLSDLIDEVKNITLIDTDTYLIQGTDKGIYAKLRYSTDLSAWEFYDMKTIHTKLGENVYTIPNVTDSVITYTDTDNYTINLINLNNIQDLVSIQNAWEYVLVEDLQEYTRYVLISSGSTYYYDGSTLTLGNPPIPYIWHVYEYIEGNEDAPKPGDEPYVYTMPYLASNIIINVDNVFNIDIDKHIIEQFIDMLKPLNINITLNVTTSS